MKYVDAKWAECHAQASSYGDDGDAACNSDPSLGVANENPRLRVLPVASDASFMVVYDGWELIPLTDATILAFNGSDEVPFNDPQRPEGWDHGLMWIYINDGLATQVVQESHA